MVYVLLVVGTEICLHSHIVATRLPFGDKMQCKCESLHIRVKAWFKVRVRVRFRLRLG